MMIEFNITNGIERDCDEICCDCDVSIDDENGILCVFISNGLQVGVLASTHRWLWFSTNFDLA